MILSQKKPQGLIRSCLIPILGFVGFLAVCFLACFILFSLNQASTGASSFLPALFG